MAKLNTKSINMRERHSYIVIIQESNDLGFALPRLRGLMHGVYFEIPHLSCIGFLSRTQSSSSSDALKDCTDLWEIFLWCLTCSASTPFSFFSVSSMVWLSSLIMAPFLVVPRIILILMDSMSILSGTIITWEIRLAPLIYKESDEFTVLDKSLNQNPQGDTCLDPVAGGIMKCAVLVFKLRVRQYWLWFPIHRIPFDFH